ncbi:MAG: GatB/YqeY domain-containing protein [Rhodocyclaceae bacterium]|nr:GatB/YqeY domain-containing protein [Rhodocyclaceae bacterium]MCE2723886.1 GatB/YqeY domain-containing protein [Betaproteobacteria bacterium]MCA3017494.1 GatB/YqeY domain-containing protein [Rhodocyclaceae bacterium]MCA3022286.1 GatB/YqeY domain-containing protein [Rhodocyclaceae bacterium]MCA3026237.1 GatB/YqeY domain-containing protein [Rhodocyclaceae bacterium]
MSLRDRINDDMKIAMKARDSERLSAIRLLTSALKQREVDERIEITDEVVLAVIEKMLKQRKDSIAQYTAGNRLDLVAKEQFEVGVLQAYMPAQLSDAELAAILDSVIAEVGAASAKDMGKVMNALRPKVAGRADMGKLSGAVKARLG